MRPTRKVSAATAGAALAAAVVGLATWAGAPDPPPGLTGALSTLAAFVAGWATTDRQDRT